LSAEGSKQIAVAVEAEVLHAGQVLPEAEDQRLLADHDLTAVEEGLGGSQIPHDDISLRRGENERKGKEKKRKEKKRNKKGVLLEALKLAANKVEQTFDRSRR
jgi:hypothetical protein